MDDDTPPGGYLASVQTLIDRLKLANSFGYDFKFGPQGCEALSSLLEKMARKLDEHDVLRNER